MNKIIITGVLTHNLELKYTSNNKILLENSIAVQRPFANQNGEREVDFINFQVWGRQAENLEKYCSKGSKIAIEGEIRVYSFNKKDGTKGYKTYVLANSIEFLDTKKKEIKQKQEEVKQKQQEINPFEQFQQELEIEESDLPFNND